MTRRRLALAIPILTSLALAAPAAGLLYENFMTPLPAGFKIATNQNSPGETMQEYIPRAESVHAWSRMITVQIFHTLRDRPGAPFLQNIVAAFQRACPAVTQSPITTGTANGYAVATMQLTCSRDPMTGKPETTLFRAITGADSFYVAQYAFGYLAGAADLQQAQAYLQHVNVCDSRAAAHSCTAAFLALSPN